MKKPRAPAGAEEIIQAAVNAACEAALRGVDLKIQQALELGVEIGAAKGAEVGAKAAVRAVERERKRFRQQQYDRRYQNTKLLLRHYRALNAHHQNAVFDTSAAEDEGSTFAGIMEFMDGFSHDEDVYIESIKRSALKTSIIMAHVNKMLEVYEILCERSHREDDKRHYRVLRALYLDDQPTPAAEIARAEHIDKRTVYKDVDASAATITTLLFGIEGIEKL